MLLWFYPVTVDDAKRASTIYGPFVANLKGTATKSTADYVVSLVPIPLPPSILEHHQHLTLCIDIFHVQKIPFFTTISRKLRFRTVAWIPDRTKSTLLHELSLV